MSLPPESPKEATCPLTTEQLCDLVMGFVELYNRPAGIYLYTFQRVFQRRIIESLLKQDSATITGLFSRQSGKSEALAALGVALAVFLPTLAQAFPGDQRLNPFLRGLWIGIFAPKQQQSDIIYGRVRTRAHLRSSLEINSDPDINVGINVSRNERVSWTNGSFIVAKTGSEHSNVEGDTFHLIFIDEAQLLSERKVSKEISPMLAATGGSMVKIGTASVFKGGFHDSIRSNIAEFEKGGPRNHFEFPYDVVIREKRKAFEETGNAFHIRYEGWVNAELVRMGGNIDNDTFKMNFRLLWQEVSGGALSTEVIEAAGCSTLDVCSERVTSRGRLVAGLDLGKTNDPTILTIMESLPVLLHDRRALVRHKDEEFPSYPLKQILGWFESFGSWEGQLTGILKYLDNFPALDTLVVDATGVGDPIAERLQLLLPHINVVPFKFGLSSSDMLFKLYLQEFENGRILYPNSESAQRHGLQQTFVYQHERLMKLYHGPFMQCEAPPGEHDDMVDSAALANYATTLEGGEGVVSLENMLYSANVPQYPNATRADRYRTPRRLGKCRSTNSARKSSGPVTGSAR